MFNIIANWFKSGERVTLVKWAKYDVLVDGKKTKDFVYVPEEEVFVFPVLPHIAETFKRDLFPGNLSPVVHEYEISVVTEGIFKEVKEEMIIDEVTYTQNIRLKKNSVWEVELTNENGVIYSVVNKDECFIYNGSCEMKLGINRRTFYNGVEYKYMFMPHCLDMGFHNDSCIDLSSLHDKSF